MKRKSGLYFWIHSVFFTLLNRFSLILFGILSYVILAKKVFPTVNEMGIWALFLTILALIEIVKQGLLRNPMIKFLSESENPVDQNKIQTASLLINIFFTATVVLILILAGKIIARWLNTPGLEPLFVWASVFIVLLIPFNHFEILLQSKYKFKSIFYGYLFRQGIFLLIILLMWFTAHTSLTLINLAKIQIFALFTGTLVLWILARPFLCRSFHPDQHTLYRMLHFGKYIFGTNLFAALGRSADQFITAGLISSDVVAYYNIASRVNNMLDVPSIATADVLYPKNVEAISSSGPDKVRYYFERTVGTIVGFVLPVSVVLFLMPGFFIQILAGPKYANAVPILQIVILFSFLRPFSFQFGATMDAIGKPRINFLVNMLITLLNYGLMYLGLRYLGWLGAAYGAVISSILGFGIIYSILNRSLGISLKETFHWTWKSWAGFFTQGKKIISGEKIF